MIDLRETENELLHFIPAPQKDRARAIQGFRWNPNRRCWVYPKTPHVYDALVAEFRDDLQDVAVARPLAPTAPSHALQGDAGLTEEIARLRRELEDARQSVRDLRAADAVSPRRSAGHAASAEALAKELAALKADLAKREAATSPVDEHARFIAFFRSLAVEAAGGSRDLAKLSKKLDSPETFPTQMAGALEAALRRRMAGRMPVGTNLTDLIARARGTDALSHEAADLAAIIVAQSMAPTSTNAGEVWARALLSLYAAALVWGELGEAA